LKIRSCAARPRAARVPGRGEQQLEDVGDLFRVRRALQEVAVDAVADLLAQAAGGPGEHLPLSCTTAA
jgi:hypothetical protein